MLTAGNARWQEPEAAGQIHSKETGGGGGREGGLGRVGGGDRETDTKRNRNRDKETETERQTPER